MVFAFLTEDFLTRLTKQLFLLNIKIIPLLQYNYIILLKNTMNIVITFHIYTHYLDIKIYIVNKFKLKKNKVYM